MFVWKSIWTNYEQERDRDRYIERERDSKEERALEREIEKLCVSAKR